jgi:hypothetical protein
MELRDFIKRALLDVVGGVEDANKEIDRFRLTSQRHHGTDENGQKVEFDISVIVNESSENNINGGLKIAALNLGGDKRQSESNQNLHKIKFEVFIKEKTGS